MKTIRILHLYEREMNMYGDRGNIITLQQRLAWRGYESEVVVAGVGDDIDWAKVDLVFGGGGQDRGQVAVGQDLQRHSQAIHAAVKAGVPMLLICGLYQLFGRAFITLDGQEIPGIGVFAAETHGSPERLIGNVVLSSHYGSLVGFENHSGRTGLDSGQDALGSLQKGYGNDGHSGEEGAVTHNVIGTYLHGPLLPKNPTLADHLLQTALRRHDPAATLQPLDDSVESLAATSAAARPQ